MKHWYICILLLIFASCSKRQYLDNVSLGNQGEVPLLLSQKPTVKDITAQEYGVLDSLGARNILGYYKEGGDIHLTDDDIRRLDIICQTATYSKTVAQEYEASLWDNKAEICPLADKELIDTCYEVLDRNMVLETDGMYGQIAVVDATSSKVLAWASLENTREEGEEYGDIAYVPFKNNVCTRNILATLYDRNLTRQVRDAERSSNGSLGMCFSCICQGFALFFFLKNLI